MILRVRRGEIQNTYTLIQVIKRLIHPIEPYIYIFHNQMFFKSINTQKVVKYVSPSRARKNI